MRQFTPSCGKQFGIVKIEKPIVTKREPIIHFNQECSLIFC